MADCNNLKNESQQRTGVIYKLTNNVDKKCYVGQTVQKLRKRLNQHKNSKTATGVDGAIKKYGWENFSYELLEVCPVEILDEREIFWIAELKTKAPNGYNLTDGGHGNRGNKMSDEQKKKIAATLKAKGIKPPSRKGIPNSPATRAKMSAALIGRTAWNKGLPARNKGIPCSDEQKKKISETMKNRHKH